MEILFTKKAKKVNPHVFMPQKAIDREENQYKKLEKEMIITELKKGHNKPFRKLNPHFKIISIEDKNHKGNKLLHPSLSFKLKNLSLSGYFQHPTELKNEEYLSCKKINLFQDFSTKIDNVNQINHKNESSRQIIKTKTIGNFKILPKMSDNILRKTVYINEDESRVKKMPHTKRIFYQKIPKTISDKNLKISIDYNKNNIKYFQSSHAESKKNLDFLTQKLIGKNKVTNLIESPELPKISPRIKVKFLKRKSIKNYIPKMEKYYSNQKSIKRLEKVNNDIKKMKGIFPFHFFKHNS